MLPLFVLCFLFQNIARAQDNKPTRRILILNEVGPSYPIINIVDNAIRTGLDKSPYKLELYYEHMEVLLFPDPADQKRFRDFYVRKYRNRLPDLIITVGPAPLRFMLEEHRKAFPGVPVVFCLPNGLVPGSRSADSDFTGVETDFAAAETLRAALRLQPGTQKVVIVGGVTDYDRQQEAIVKEQLNRYRHVEVSYLTNLTMPVLLERLRRLSKRTVVLMTTIGEDAAGTRFTSSEIGPMIAADANAPVFSLADLYLGHGEVGGDVADLGHQGQIAASLALRILRGEKPRDIPPVKGVNTFKFDWKAIQRWRLKEGNLPPGSVLLNRPPSFWELYKSYISTGFFLLLLQAAAIFALLWQGKKKRRIEMELLWRLQFESLLSELSTTFINLPEEQVDRNIARGLARLGEFLKIDRISLLQFSQDHKDMRTICSWSDPGAMPALISPSHLVFRARQALHGEVSPAGDLDRLPEQTLAEREDFLQKHILSAASVPVKVGGEIDGAISFLSVRRRVEWTENLISQLRAIGEIFWNALQRKRAVEALLLTQATLRESEERFRLVANTAPVMIWMSGTDKGRTYFNQPWLAFTGHSLEEQLGNGWVQGVHPEDLENCLDAFANSFNRREPFQHEYRLRRHDGEYRWVLVHGVPRFDAEGSFAGYIGSGIDVSERKQAEAALSSVSRKLIEAHEEERTWIARELHDDFSQRIALLAVNLDRLKQGLRASEVQTKHRVEEACERVSDLGSDIQALSHRLHSSKLEYLGLLAASTGFCRELSDRQGVEIDFHSENVPKGLPKEISLCLFRVLQEALQNATKHSRSRQFGVWLRGREDEIELIVRDSGIGFDPESTIEGQGLGITSMRERLKLIDGQLFIDSNLQSGTTIRARAPLGPKKMAARAGERMSVMGA
jgi:PAS domain S-box-containing protein